VNEPRWISLADLIATNRAVVAASGEPYALRDPQLLESACSVPANRWHYGEDQDLASLASTLLFAVARNHPFLQGNKRTGFAAAVNFLSLNGWNLSGAIDTVEVAEHIVLVLEGKSDPASFAVILRDHISRLD
jgi:death-on-curing protein